MLARIARFTGVLALAICSQACSSPADEPVVLRAPPKGRLAPPAELQCDRNQLTSYSGTVSAFDREADATHIEITTDWGHVEAFTLPHADGQPELNYLLWGKTFRTADWVQIESAPGVLREDMQAIVWVCEDSAVPSIVDWRPGRPGTDRGFQP